MGSLIVPDPPCGTEACAELLRSLVVAADHRDVIGMAKGLLIASRPQTPDDAFEVLRRASMRENVKLWQIAARMVSASASPPAAGPRAVTQHAGEAW